MRRVVFLAVLAATLAPAVNASAETAAEKRMAQQIGSHIKQSGQLSDYKFGIQFHDGVAKLIGTVASAEQRDAAVRLVKECHGVSKVDCQLEFPAEAKPAANNDRHQLAEALDRATYAAAENEASGVVHAYQQPDQSQMMAAQQSQMMQRNNARMMNNPRMARNNMPMPMQGPMQGPMPMQRNPGMMPVRQASATGVYQTGGSCPTCNGGAGMGPGPCGPGMGGPGMGGPGGPGSGMEAMPSGFVPQGAGRGPSYDNPQMPGYAWPSYASYPNYAALSYPQQYSPTAWPYIGPFYPYPQVPLAWRKVSLEWDDGWWFLDFSAHNSSH